MGRGLHNFIRDLKNASTPEKETKRVAEELAKVRTKFRGGKELTPYEKKKYVTKLLYIFMLGYDVDFGVIESVHLLAMVGFAEKIVGYLAVSLLLDEHHEMMQLVINSVRNDLQLSMDTLAGENQCLALGLLSNLGAGPFMEELCPHVKRLLSATGVPGFVKKRAALCLVHMNRKSEAGELMHAEEMAKPIFLLLEENDVGLCTSVV
jgi:AP-2 complex subunit alpha